MVEFANTTIKVFDDVVLKDDGTVRVVDPDGNELCRYRPEQYLEHIAEAVLP